MDADEHNRAADFEVGDIVTESTYIIPPNRKPWTGIIVYIEEEHYELHSFLGQFEDLLGLHWFQAGFVETLPASVILLIQKANTKQKDNKKT